MDETGHFLPQKSERTSLRRLGGKTVMLTRPPAQSGEMAARLIESGARVIHCPTIEIAEPATWGPLDAALTNLEGYDWLIFTSVNGVEHFFRRFAEKQGDAMSLLSHVRTCAVGPATARALVSACGRVDVTAGESRAEGVLAALIEAVGGVEHLAGLRFLLPRARVARDLLPEELIRFGAHVDAVEAYQTLRPDIDRADLIRLMTDNHVDAITFTSPSTVANFAALIGNKDLSDTLRGLIVASIGPVTTEALRARGITQIIQSQAYNAIALVEALVEALGQLQ
ncbi:MAG: uroporphyrinogen-III synthase [Blastocatellia bacterium]